MKVCGCTLPYMNPDACKNCASRGDYDNSAWFIKDEKDSVWYDRRRVKRVYFEKDRLIIEYYDGNDRKGISETAN